MAEQATCRRGGLRASMTPVLLVCLLPAVAAAVEGAGPRDPTHRMMVLVIQLGLILFAAKLGNVLFEKLRLPGPLGELVAGMLIGPYGLGQLAFHGFPEGLFPRGELLGVSPELYGLAAIASVVLMFNVGLETDLGLLLRYSAAGGLVGLGGVAVSFLVGAGIVSLFSPAMGGRPLGLLAPRCLIMGVIATATSVGITARILSERGKLNSPEGVTVLSAAVIDDVIGIVLLAAVMGIVAAGRTAGGVDWGHVGIVSAKAVGVWLTATALGLLASRRISLVLKWFRERTAIAIMALGLALVLAGLFEEVGLAMIIGAYVMGLSLSKADISHAVREKLHPIYGLLVPVFFCVTGMRIDVTVLGSSSVLWFGAAYAAAAMAAKLTGCGLPALLANFNLRGAARIGLGMAPRCEVALIIAGTALTAGLLEPQLFAAVVIMVVVNSIVAPPALTRLFRGDLPGTRRPLPTGGRARTEVAFDMPSEEVAELLTGKLAAAFESEGFFVYLLNRQEMLYQLRKDETIIDFRCDGTSLRFFCDRRDVPLVNTAMYEAAAAVEQAVRALKEPVDSNGIATRLQEAAPAAKARPSLAAYLRPELVEPALRARTKAEVIEELLDLIQRQGLLADREAAARDVWQREESMSTGLQHGVAIPHGRTEAVNRLVCAVGLKREGIDYGSMDGKPSKVFILTLSPKDRPTPYMRFMSVVGQVLDDARRPHILAARTREELYELLAGKPVPSAALPAGAPATFDLADYVRPELLAPELKGRTPEAVIDELLGLLDREGRLGDLERARRAVLAREAQMPTGLQDGVAIPHGRTDAVEGLLVAVGLHRKGVDFGAPDGKPARIVVLALTTTDGADPYLQFVAAVIAALNARGRRELLAARTSGEMYRAITGREVPAAG